MKTTPALSIVMDEYLALSWTFFVLERYHLLSEEDLFWLGTAIEYYQLSKLQKLVQKQGSKSRYCEIFLHTPNTILDDRYREGIAELVEKGYIVQPLTSATVCL